MSEPETSRSEMSPPDPTGPATAGRTPIMTPAGFNPPARPPEELGLRSRVVTFWKKNRALTSNPAFWRLVPRILAFKLRTAVRPSKLRSNPEVLFVATHHKAMTTYFHAVLRGLAFALNLPFERLRDSDLPSGKAKLFLSMQGKQDLSALGPYRGVHVMRDPRDMIVSGYHYHKWTHEIWVHRLDENGESYQDKLNRLEKSAGLFLEINHFIFFYRDTLEAWDMDDPAMLEVSYEALMGPEKRDLYRNIFAHLGFEGAELELAVDLMKLFEAESRTGKASGAVNQKSHVRSGKSGQWEAELEPQHLDYMDRHLGPILQKFGYY
jgi:hypothetical protein